MVRSHDRICIVGYDNIIEFFLLYFIAQNLLFINIIKKKYLIFSIILK